MVRHIVMFRLAADSDRARLAKEFKEAIEKLPAVLPTLDAVAVGINDGPAAGNWDIVLTADCADYDALQAYSAAPEHVACVAIIKAAMEARACVDYTIL